MKNLILYQWEKLKTHLIFLSSYTARIKHGSFLCVIFFKAQSSSFFVYCEVSINLVLLSYALVVLAAQNGVLTALPGVHRPVFVTAASPTSR